MRRFRVGDTVRVRKSWSQPFHPCAIIFEGDTGEVIRVEHLGDVNIYWVDFGEAYRDKIGSDYGIGTFYYNNLELLE